MIGVESVSTSLTTPLVPITIIINYYPRAPRKFERQSEAAGTETVIEKLMVEGHVMENTSTFIESEVAT